MSEDSLKRKRSDVRVDVFWVLMNCIENLSDHHFLWHRKGLKANGTLTAGSLADLSYSYVVATDNDNGRYLKGFSSNANVKMRHDEDVTKEFFPDFQKVNLILHILSDNVSIINVLLTIECPNVVSVL